MKTFNPLILAHNFYKKFISRTARQNAYQALSNFIYEKSNDMPVIVLALNAIGILSGHFAQIGGLKRSKRENKDYLIKQEMSEIGLDLIITIIPPFIIDKLLEKQVITGKLTTKDFREFLIRRLAPTIGVELQDLYEGYGYVGPIDMIKNTLNSVKSSIKQNPKIPKKIRNLIKIPPPKPTTKVPIGSLDLMGAYAGHPKYAKLFKDCPNGGNVKDKVCGQLNGYRIAPTLLYTIIASNIIIPIISNKMAKKSYRKELAKKGETPESIKRKKRYNHLIYVNETKGNDNTFNIFSNIDNTTTKNKVKDRNIYNNLITIKTNSTDIFSNINKQNRISSQSNGLRI